jgi:hypothetical protein
MGETHGTGAAKEGAAEETRAAARMIDEERIVIEDEF